MVRRVDLDFTISHGPVGGPINGALGAIVLAMLAPFVDMSAWFPPALAALASGAAWAVGWRMGTPTLNIAYRAVCWLGAGIWTALVIWLGEGRPGLPSIVVLGIGALLAGMLAPAFSGRAAPVRTARFGSTTLPGQWAHRIANVCGIREGVDIIGMTNWPDRSGFTLRIDFPAESGYTWEILRDHATQLGAAAKLKRGCVVRAEVGDHQGEALLHVPTANSLVEIRTFPLDYSPRSVRDEFDLGQFSDRALALAEVFQSSAIVAGARGGGKTVILHDMTGQLVRCVDAVVWHVDLNGGGMPAPWTMPFALGETDRPAVDWVANGPTEALLMAEAALRIAKDRKARYLGLMSRNNTDVLPVTSDLPALIIIVDEGGEILGDEAERVAVKAAAALREVQRIGRAMCVNVVFSVQRATADYVPAQMKKNATLRICTKVQDDDELAYLFDWNKSLRSADLLDVGYSYILRGDGGMPSVFRSYHLLPAQIMEIARATAHLRPYLDEPARVAAGRVYDERWTRAQRYLDILAGRDDGGYVDDDDQDDEPEDDEPAASPPATIAEAMDRMKRASEALQNDTFRSVLERPEDAIAAEFDAILSLPTVEKPRRPGDPLKPPDGPSGGEPPAARAAGLAPPPRSVRERRDIMVAVIDAAGPEGMRPGGIQHLLAEAGIPVSMSTLHEWLRAEVDDRRVVWLRQGWYTTPRHTGGHA